MFQLKHKTTNDLDSSYLSYFKKAETRAVIKASNNLHLHKENKSLHKSQNEQKLTFCTQGNTI